MEEKKLHPALQLSHAERIAFFNNSRANSLWEPFDITLTVAEPERVVATMPVKPNVMQQLGYLHGGASVALAESLASLGTALNTDPTHQLAFGLEINANHLRPKQAGMLTGEARPIHKGRTTWVWSIEIRDEANKLVCISRCTVAIVERPNHETPPALVPTLPNILTAKDAKA